MSAEAEVQSSASTPVSVIPRRGKVFFFMGVMRMRLRCDEYPVALRGQEAIQ